jgi:hypothetical protein
MYTLLGFVTGLIIGGGLMVVLMVLIFREFPNFEDFDD